MVGGGAGAARAGAAMADEGEAPARRRWRFPTLVGVNLCLSHAKYARDASTRCPACGTSQDDLVWGVVTHVIPIPPPPGRTWLRCVPCMDPIAQSFKPYLWSCVKRKRVSAPETSDERKNLV